MALLEKIVQRPFWLDPACGLYCPYCGRLVDRGDPEAIMQNFGRADGPLPYFVMCVVCGKSAAYFYSTDRTNLFILDEWCSLNFVLFGLPRRLESTFLLTCAACGGDVRFNGTRVVPGRGRRDPVFACDACNWAVLVPHWNPLG